MSAFEADLCLETGAPRVRFNFSNGWAASVVMLGADGTHTRYNRASLAACPQGHWNTGQTILGETEANPEEVVVFLAMVAAKEPHPAGVKVWTYGKDDVRRRTGQ